MDYGEKLLALFKVPTGFLDAFAPSLQTLFTLVQM
jgi:hypothetical protein